MKLLNEIRGHLSVFSWKNLRFNRKRFLIYLIIGIIVTVCYYATDTYFWGNSKIEKFIDKYIFNEAKNFADVKKADPRKLSPHIVFIDIDHGHFKAMGKPDLIPRDIIANLLQTVTEAGANLIIVDLLLNQKGQEFDYLYSTLTQIKNSESKTKIIIPIRVSPEDKEASGQIFSKLVDNKKIFFSTTAISTGQYDAIYRYWLPFEKYSSTGCKDNIDSVVWGLPLLTTLLMENREYDELKQFEPDIINKSSKELMLSLNFQSRFYISELVNKSENRIRFSLIPKGVFKSYGDGNITQSVFRADLNELIHFKDRLKNKIVIIGCSSKDAGDTYITPIGYVPGMYIMGNAINTIISYKHPSQFSFFIEIFIILFVLLILSLGLSFGLPRWIEWLLLFLIGPGVSWGAEVLFTNYNLISAEAVLFTSSLSLIEAVTTFLIKYIDKPNISSKADAI